MTSTRAEQVERLRRRLVAVAAASFAATFGLVAHHARAGGSGSSQAPAQVQQDSSGNGFFAGSDNYSFGDSGSSSGAPAGQSRVS